MHCTLPDKPLDIIGDIHGELDALDSVLSHLGYNADGEHPEGRYLVFVGDLIDRGPNSVGVANRVRKLIQAGRAAAILGNHELNLLRGERKHGNDWFWGEENPHDAIFAPFTTASREERTEILRFFSSLPLTLSRQDLRITHAAWHEPSLTALADTTQTKPIGELFSRFDQQVDSALSIGGWLGEASKERSQWREDFVDSKIAMPMLPAIAHCDEMRQMQNPLRVLTSGIERTANEPFFSSGQWRFTERVPWWNEYKNNIPVVVGHFWRQYIPTDRSELGKGGRDLFEGTPPTSWLGPLGNVFCVDFSVGGRYQERRSGVTGARTRLAALRWPERELVLDTGATIPTQGFGCREIA
jgi:hypothetical protein